MELEEYLKDLLKDPEFKAKWEAYKESKKTGDFKFFCNKDCGYFPCHKTNDLENFNCLFCYCPLYALGENCGGNFKYIDGGIKDCSDCLLPHNPKGYFYIQNKYMEIMELAKKKEK